MEGAVEVSLSSLFSLTSANSDTMGKICKKKTKTFKY